MWGAGVGVVMVVVTWMLCALLRLLPVIYFHHAGAPVRKSVSVQGVRVTLPSGVVTCASASESGAGPRTTLPVVSGWGLGLVGGGVGWSVGGGWGGAGDRSERRASDAATHARTGLVVLGAVARAHELVLGLVPGHDAAEVRADGVEAVLLDGLVLLHDQVRRVALEALVYNGGGVGVTVAACGEPSTTRFVQSTPHHMHIAPGTAWPRGVDSTGWLVDWFGSITCTRERSPGRCVESQPSTVTSLPSASLASSPPPLVGWCGCGCGCVGGRFVMWRRPSYRCRRRRTPS